MNTTSLRGGPGPTSLLASTVRIACCSVRCFVLRVIEIFRHNIESSSILMVLVFRRDELFFIRRQVNQIDIFTESFFTESLMFRSCRSTRPHEDSVHGLTI